MNEIIKIENVELTLGREFLTNEENIKKIQIQIEGLKSMVFDFSTKEGVKQAKELKTKANHFVKNLNEFCKPLEAEGKAIADARSAINTKLVSGKQNVIDEILKPVSEREDKIKLIKSKLFLTSHNAASNLEKLAEVESLENYEWLAFSDEALPLIEQHKTFLLNEKIKFDAEAKAAAEAAEAARIARENQIKAETEARVKAEAQKQIDEANRRAEQAKIDAERRLEAETRNKIQEEAKLKTEEEAKAKNVQHQAKIHNETLEDMMSVGMDEESAKNLIKSIVKGQIRNLKITY